jgi:hypothetical protein
MKKHLLASTALILGAAFAMPAMADVIVTGTVTKDEDIVVREFITETKTVTITVTQDFIAFTAAQAVSVYNQRNTGNILRRDFDDPLPGTATDPATFSCATCGPAAVTVTAATILASYNNNTGVVLWNQDVGNNANQANNITIAVAENAYYARSVNSAEQRTERNFSFVFGIFPLVTKSAVMDGSVRQNTGVVMINQNAGFASNQYNSLTAALSLDTGAGVALADADLGQWNQNNQTFDFNSTRVGTISNSVVSNQGVTAVNQNTGNFNNQATIISFAGGR